MEKKTEGNIIGNLPIDKIKAEIERLKEEAAINKNRPECNHDIWYQQECTCIHLLSFIESIEQEQPTQREELRYCIEYINPRIPFLQNGSLNIRHYRIPEFCDVEHAENVLTTILSFGAKIVALYRGNVLAGKLAEWPTPMIVNEDDWVTDKWLKSFKQEPQSKIEDIQREWYNKGYLKGRKEAYIPARELGLPSSLDNNSLKIRGWVARDEDGKIFIYNDKPFRGISAFGPAYDGEELPKSWFPELKWEDEPIEVELTIRRV